MGTSPPQWEGQVPTAEPANSTPALLPSLASWDKCWDWTVTGLPGQGAVKRFAYLPHKDADYFMTGGRGKPEAINIAQHPLDGQDCRFDVVQRICAHVMLHDNEKAQDHLM